MTGKPSWLWNKQNPWYFFPTFSSIPRNILEKLEKRNTIHTKKSGWQRTKMVWKNGLFLFPLNLMLEWCLQASFRFAAGTKTLFIECRNRKISKDYMDSIHLVVLCGQEGPLRELGRRSTSQRQNAHNLQEKTRARKSNSSINSNLIRLSERYGSIFVNLFLSRRAEKWKWQPKPWLA